MRTTLKTEILKSQTLFEKLTNTRYFIAAKKIKLFKSKFSKKCAKPM